MDPVLKRLTELRINLLNEFPFFGRLLYKITFGLDDCGTAYTDMRHIVFDPKFASRISDVELRTVLMHEILHCALKHCTRSAGKDRFKYNIACDIVVNSYILEITGMEEIEIDGEEIMHLAPNGKEGHLHTAEEIYFMLMKMKSEDIVKMYGGEDYIKNHKAWGEIDHENMDGEWDKNIRDVALSIGEGSGIPDCLTRYIREVEHSPRTNWKQVLHDFIQFDKYDYDFMRPDRRYSTSVILPSFYEDMDGCMIKDVWFLVDTSGSVSDEAVSLAYSEIKQAAMQINISGMISFFDYVVSEPIEFESLEDILKIKPIGGGGTNFKAIFKKLGEMDELPRAMIIITDGYDNFPSEEAALGVPVIWLIVDSDVVPPWGVYAFISTKD